MSLKHDVKNINTPLEKIQLLNGVSFNWIDQCDATRKYGMIADDVEKIIPEAVTTDDQGLRSIDYVAVTAHLVEAVKGLSAKVDALSRR